MTPNRLGWGAFALFLAATGGCSGSSAVASGPDAIRVGFVIRAAGGVANRLVGVALSAAKLANQSYATVAGREFDYVTPENETPSSRTSSLRRTQPTPRPSSSTTTTASRPPGPKADAAYALAVKLKSDGAAIQGVGLQNHDALTSPAPADLAANMQRLVAQGFVVNISELDITECAAASGQGNTAQATQWHAIAAVCVAQARCNGIMTWGIDDADSWKTLDTAFNCTTGDPLPYPLMFDDSFAPKPSYTAMLNALPGEMDNA
jgi:glycosyl hydrolase family 10